MKSLVYILAIFTIILSLTTGYSYAERDLDLMKLKPPSQQEEQKQEKTPPFTIQPKTIKTPARSEPTNPKSEITKPDIKSSKSSEEAKSPKPEPPLDPNQLIVLLYYPRTTNFSCTMKNHVERRVKKSNRLYHDTLTLLFQGPLEKEKENGIGDPFHPEQLGAWYYPNEGARPFIDSYKGLKLNNGVATVYFSSDALDYLNHTVCTRQSLKGSIEQTLLQFEPIKKVVIAVNGRALKD